MESPRQRTVAIAIMVLRYLTVAVVCAGLGGILFMTLLAQERSPPYRPPSPETTIELNRLSIEVLRSDVTRHESLIRDLGNLLREQSQRTSDTDAKVSTLEGWVQGLCAAVGLLEVLKAFVGRLKKSDS